MKRKIIFLAGLLVAVAVGAFIYRNTMLNKGREGASEQTASGQTGATKLAQDGQVDDGKVRMSVAIQAQNGVVIGQVKKERLKETISVTGKVEANADRIAHVAPRISGTIVNVSASLGDTVAAGQVLATLDSIELVDALNRYYQSMTKLSLAKSDMERVRILVDKKIAARKEIRQAETEFRIAETELHTDKERLALYGVNPSQIKGGSHTKTLLPVRSPIGGVVTEKHAIIGELADPSKSLYTVADLSSVWIVVDINEKDLGKIRIGQPASVTIVAYPGLQSTGRITFIADLMDQNTHTVKARIELPNNSRKLKPEMLATVELVMTDDVPPVLVIPEEALQDMDGKKVVFVAEKAGEFTPRPVQTGRSAGGMVEVVSGLKEGESCAVKGSFILKSELRKGELSDE